MKHITVKQGMRTAVVMLFAGALMLSLSGCFVVRDNDEQERIAKLERELDELRTQQDQTDKSKDAATDSKGSTDKGNPADQGTTSTDATVQDFAKRVDELIARSQAATVPSDRNAKIEAFFALDAEFDALDTEMDAYGDKREAEYRAGTITWEEYRAIDRSLEELEHRLSAEQDSLELRFGIDD